MMVECVYVCICVVQRTPINCVCVLCSCSTSSSTITPLPHWSRRRFSVVVVVSVSVRRTHQKPNQSQTKPTNRSNILPLFCWLCTLLLHYTQFNLINIHAHMYRVVSVIFSQYLCFLITFCFRNYSYIVI